MINTYTKQKGVKVKISNEELEKSQLAFYRLANGLMGIAYIALLVFGVVKLVELFV